MTREDILRQMAALQTQLDELDTAQGAALFLRPARRMELNTVFVMDDRRILTG